MIIKKARPKDARKISLLRRKTIKERNKNDYPKIFVDTIINKNSPKEIVNKMKTRNMFCAWDGDTLVGTVDLEGDKIGGLFVKSSEIGKGIGTKLMDFIENYAHSKKIKQARLYSTKFAVNFYKKRGFYPVDSGYWIIGKSKSKDRVMKKELSKNRCATAP
jgi:N-acetylglutamate synthase-like GNAT family acetyltransferase